MGVLSVLSMFLVVGMGVGPAAWADDLDLGKTCQNLPAATDASVSFKDRAYIKICQDQAAVECSVDNLAGCAKITRTPGALPKVDFATAATKTDVDALSAKIEPKLTDLETKAEKCCGDGNDCPLDKESEAAKARIAAASANTAGVNQTTGVSASSFGDSLAYNAYVAGSCRAYRAICTKGFKDLAKNVDMAKCKSLPLTNNDNCQGFVIDKNSHWEEQSKHCAELDSIPAENRAVEISQNVDQSKAGQLSTQSAGAPGQPGKGGTGPDERFASGGGDGSGSSSAGTGLNGTQTGGGAGAGLGSMAQMLPMAAMAMMAMQQQQQQQPAAAAATPQAAGDCSSNPALAGCTPVHASPAAWTTQNNSAGLQPESKSTTGGSFGLGSNADQYKPANAGIDPASNNNPITTHGVSNGGGGFVGGGGGGGSPGGGGGGRGGGGSSGASTDILHGEGGGGGGGGSSLASLNQGLNTQTAGGGGGGYGGGNQNGNDGLGVGLQLADFLPGGRKDPARNIASVNGGNTQIQPKTVNIWSRISEHIRSRCAQGLLRDCGPQ